MRFGRRKLQTRIDGLKTSSFGPSECLRGDTPSRLSYSGQFNKGNVATEVSRTRGFGVNGQLATGASFTLRKKALMWGLDAPLVEELSVRHGADCLKRLCVSLWWWWRRVRESRCVCVCGQARRKRFCFQKLRRHMSSLAACRLCRCGGRLLLFLLHSHNFRIAKHHETNNLRRRDSVDSSSTPQHETTLSPLYRSFLFDSACAWFFPSSAFLPTFELPVASARFCALARSTSLLFPPAPSGGPTRSKISP